MTLTAAALADIQGLLLSGYPDLPHAAFLLLRVRPGETEQIGAVLDRLIPRITAAIEDPRQLRVAVNIAFSASGLRALGVGRAVLDSFSPAFADGIAGSEYRSRILGDEDENDPCRWSWGSRQRPVDMLVLVYGREEHDATRTAATILRALRRSVRVVRPSVRSVVMTRQTPQGRPVPMEHFGFADGMSQPHFDPRRPGQRDQVRPGEFIFGYPDESGPDGASEGPIVPLAMENHGLRRAPRREAWDLGANGSYLVARQMEEHVDRFWNFAFEQGGGTGPGAVELAERMVGRKMDSTPLVGDLQFKRLDPHGLRCPFGAHVRRVNPRDHLEPAQQNRHRLLRRGRTYGTAFRFPDGSPAGMTAPVQDDGKRRGLMFLALNADIERQFEFIHQNWINHGAFHGLVNEHDPLVGRRRDSDTMTMAGRPVRTRVEGLPRFVTVAGGEYFFLPGLAALGYLAAQARRPVSGAAEHGREAEPALVERDRLSVRHRPV